MAKTDFCDRIKQTIQTTSSGETYDVKKATIFDETQVEYNAPNSKISMARKRRLRLKQSRICRKLTDDMKSPIGLVISFCDENTPNENNIIILYFYYRI